MKYLIAAFLLFLPTQLLAMDLMLQNPWIPIAPPGAKVHAAYVDIHNHGKTPKTLISASSHNYNMVHIHLSEEKNGVSTMTMVEQIEIPAGVTFSMKLGSFHIMLMGPKEAIELGSEVPLTLSFADGSAVKFNAIVKERHAHHTHNH